MVEFKFKEASKKTLKNILNYKESDSSNDVEKNKLNFISFMEANISHILHKNHKDSIKDKKQTLEQLVMLLRNLKGAQKIIQMPSQRLNYSLFFVFEEGNNFKNELEKFIKLTEKNYEIERATFPKKMKKESMFSEQIIEDVIWFSFIGFHKYIQNHPASYSESSIFHNTSIEIINILSAEYPEIKAYRSLKHIIKPLLERFNYFIKFNEI